MIVYQTREDGVFVGTAIADPDPMVEGRFAIPGGCVEICPPPYGPGYRARFEDGNWVIERDPQLYFDNPERMTAFSQEWDGETIILKEHPCPEFDLKKQLASWTGMEWVVDDLPEPKPEPPAPMFFISQDLLAQFTTDDITKIMAAVQGNAQMALLWYSLLAQRDSMVVDNARVKAGWKALIQVLGQARMDEIAAALKIVVTV